MMVLLKDGTVGEVVATDLCDTAEVIEVTVFLHDENGMPVEKTGHITEILED